MIVNFLVFNYDNSKSNARLNKNHPKAARFFKEIFSSAEPLGYILGNGKQTIEYTANGEASDWMLGERGVYAISPELGSLDRGSESFFIKSSSVL